MQSSSAACGAKCVKMQTLKNVSPNANTAPMAAPNSLPALHSVDMRESVGVRVAVNKHKQIEK
jgi:hypothetical protein